MDVATLAPGIEAAYTRGRESGLAVRHPAPGVVRIDGGDRLDFLHRLSTNNLATLPEGKAVPTVLTTPLARIIDLVWVLSRHDHALLITGPDRGQTVLNWLNRYIFFQDDVRLSLVSQPGSLLGFYGPEAVAAVQVSFPALASVEGGGAHASDGLLAWAVSSPALSGVRVLVDSSDGRHSDLSPDHGAAQAAYTALRIEAGAPEHDTEINAEAIPLEVGLQDAISFTKGCYIGQEIIARMETRNRRARMLLGLQLEAPEPAGATLRQEGTAVGRMTSTAFSPRLGWIGLAAAKPSAIAEHGGRVFVGEGETAGQLVDLPM